MGIIGDLSDGEILEQLLHANTVEPIRNVVFMVRIRWRGAAWGRRDATPRCLDQGMGEPLNNYDAVASALLAMKDSRQFNLKAGSNGGVGALRCASHLL
jgi:sorting nexin-8